MLPWGAVLINGFLAWLFVSLFLEYQWYILALLKGLGVPVPSPEALPQIDIVSKAAVYTALTAGAIIYAVTVDNTPSRLFKGMAIAFIAIAIQEGATKVQALSALFNYLTEFYRSIVEYIGNILAAPLGFGAVALVPTLLLLDALDIPGKVLTGMLFALYPYVLAVVWHIYDRYIGDPFFKAATKLVGTLAKRMHLGFLMPFALYIITVVSYILSFPVTLFLIGWTLSIVLFVIIKYAIGSIAALVLDVVFYLLGVIVATTLSTWMNRILEVVSDRAIMYSSPVLLVLVALFGLAPIVFTLVYAVSLSPVILLLVSIMLVASPVLRKSTEVVVNVFTTFFMLTFVLTLVAAFSAAGPQAVATCLIGAVNATNATAHFVDVGKAFSSFSKCLTCYLNSTTAGGALKAAGFETCVFGAPVTDAGRNNQNVPPTYYWPKG